MANDSSAGLGGYVYDDVKMWGSVEPAALMGQVVHQMLESWDCRVRIFEKNAKICQHLTERLSETTVINADATVVAELEEEQVLSMVQVTCRIQIRHLTTPLVEEAVEEVEPES